jgi:rhodanese-related sulfurtransferase
MERSHRAAPLVLALLGAALLIAACRADFEGLQTLSVEELSAWRGERGDFAVFDANTDDTRARYGVIPGAVLLSSYRDYAPDAELGSDRDRAAVFYCHSVRCGAAADAARRAVAAGYRDVWVLEDGITGWADAGAPIAAHTATEETS